jgi:tRNA/tmRNA/rRNA uracil-C5-methylase (TrmA/RlmC/RlmD family)
MRQARFLPDCEIEVSENIDASERVAHIEFQATAATAATAATVVPDGLAPDDLTGLVVSSRRDGRVRSTVVSGDAHVTDRVPVEHHHVRLRRHVLAFFQGNRFLLSALVSQVLSHVREGASVVDLYAGVGLFAVSAAAVRGARVTAVEGSRVSASDLACNADGMLEPVCDSVERFLGVANKAADVVIADPPRTGLSQDALEGIVRLGAPTFAYVSCDVATLARDARALCAAGYRLDGLVGFDLFPNTPHVETVATFTRDHVAGA